MSVRNPDLVNGCFEAIGSICVWLNVRRLWIDKEVKGVDWRVSAFFWTWGAFNIWFYPHLGLWASFAGGVMLCVGNFAWLALALRYR